MEKAYHVVNFLEENKISVVPKLWLLNDNKCYWPGHIKTDTALLRAIQGCENPSENWNIHHVKRLSKEESCYDEAQKKAKRGCWVSDVENSETDDRRSRSQRHKNTCSRYLSADEVEKNKGHVMRKDLCRKRLYDGLGRGILSVDNKPPVNPQQRQFLSSTENIAHPSHTFRASDGTPNRSSFRPSAATESNTFFSAGNTGTDISYTERDFMHSSANASVMERQNCFSIESEGHTVRNPLRVDSLPYQERRISSPIEHAASTFQSPVIRNAGTSTTAFPLNTSSQPFSCGQPIALLSKQNSHSAISSKTNEPFHDPNVASNTVFEHENWATMLEILLDIQRQVHINTKRLDSTSAMVADVLSKEKDVENEMHNLLFEDFQNFMEFDKKLKDDFDFFNKYVALLSTIGGNGYDDAARNILKQLMATNVCLRFNWIGVLGKAAFRDLKSVQLIIAATQKHRSKKHYTDARILSVIKSWVRNVGDRNGGRDRRRRKEKGGEHLDADAVAGDDEDEFSVVVF